MSLHIAVLQHIITECANLWLHDLDRIYRYHLLGKVQLWNPDSGVSFTTSLE